jgi:hypothetical protein
METGFLQTTEYDEWNRFVDESPQGDVFCCSWWLEAVTKGDFQIIAARENKRIVAGFILPFYSTGRINEPFLTRTTGVLYRKPGDESLRGRLSMERRWLTALLGHVDKDSFVQTCMHHNFKDWLPFRWQGYEQRTRYTYLLDYTHTSTDAIMANISRKQRAMVQKALRNKLTVEEGDDMASVYNFSCASFARQGRKFPYSLNDLQRLDDALRKRGQRVIFKVLDADGSVHAVNYVVYNQKSAYHLLIGGDARARLTGGHALLLLHTIKYFSDKVEIFNFGGSDIQGIEEHIRTFGGIQAQYFHIYNDDLMRYSQQCLRDHSARILYHGKEIFRDLRKRSTKEYCVLTHKLLGHLLGKIRKRTPSP